MRAQAGLEYLLTYGWALIAIATIIGILVMLTGSNVNTETCTNFLHLICKGVVTDGSRVTLILQNATGQAITINPRTGIAFGGTYGLAIIDFQGTEFRNESVTIGPGEEFTITATTMAEEITITYYETQTGLTRTETSTIGTGNPEKTGISACGTTISEPGLYVLEGNLSTGGGNCIDVNVSNVTIDCQSHSITGGGSNGGIVIAENVAVENISIVNCEISNFETGIYAKFVKDSSISNNTVYDNATGIRVDGAGFVESNRNIVSNNTVYSNNDGIQIVNEANDNMISNNTAYQNTNGIRLSGSRRNVVSENDTSNGNDYGIFAEYESEVQIIGNTANNNSGDKTIYVTEGHYASINNNKLKGNAGNGIVLVSSINSEINGNQISEGGNDRHGIFIANFIELNPTLLNNNTITEQELGIRIIKSEVELNNNTVCTTTHAIYCDESPLVTGSGNITTGILPGCPGSLEYQLCPIE